MLRLAQVRLLGFTIILFIVWGIIRQPDTPILAPPEAVSGATEVARYPAHTSALPPDEETTLLFLNTWKGAYRLDQLRVLQAPLATALHYVGERTAMHLAEPITVRFEPATACSIDGITYPAKRLIVVRVCSDTPLERAVTILAHEFVHQLAYDHYGPASTTVDLVLSEGFATWGAGDYWLGDTDTFRSFVQQHYAGQMLPLWSHYRDDAPPASMNQLYYQWASLIEWIMTTRGRDTFDRLYATSRTQQPGSAGYVEVLGAPCQAIEH